MLANTVFWLIFGSPYQALKRSKVSSRESKAPLTFGYCARTSYPPRSVCAWFLNSAAMVRKPLGPSDRPFQADIVRMPPSDMLREILAGTDQVAPAGGWPVRMSYSVL